MCLYIAKPRNKERTKAYKVLLFHSWADRYVTYYQRERVYLGQTLKSNRKSKKKNCYEDVHVHFGIHVFTNLVEARYLAAHNPSQVKIVEVEVNPKDWIADGAAGEAVYMKVFLTNKIHANIAQR